MVGVTSVAGGMTFWDDVEIGMMLAGRFDLTRLSESVGLWNSE